MAGTNVSNFCCLDYCYLVAIHINLFVIDVCLDPVQQTNLLWLLLIIAALVFCCFVVISYLNWLELLLLFCFRWWTLGDPLLIPDGCLNGY
jgi:hypothetical protein